jgi:hypothetical protein
MDKHEYKHTQGVIACMRIKEGRALQALITKRHVYVFCYANTDLCLHDTAVKCQNAHLYNFCLITISQETEIL